MVGFDLALGSRRCSRPRRRCGRSATTGPAGRRAPVRRCADLADVRRGHARAAAATARRLVALAWLRGTEDRDRRRLAGRGADPPGAKAGLRLAASRTSRWRSATRAWRSPVERLSSGRRPCRAEAALRLTCMDLQLLQQTLAELGEPPFRGRQVWRGRRRASPTTSDEPTSRSACGELTTRSILHAHC